MDYLSHAESRSIDGRQLYFIRCDKNGAVLSDEELRLMAVTNPTIEALVGEVSARISFADGDDGAFSLKSC